MHRLEGAATVAVVPRVTMSSAFGQRSKRVGCSWLATRSEARPFQPARTPDHVEDCFRLRPGRPVQRARLSYGVSGSSAGCPISAEGSARRLVGVGEPVLDGNRAEKCSVVRVRRRESDRATQLVVADGTQKPPKLPPPRAGQGSIHVAIEAGLVDLVALVGKAREQTRSLLIEGRALLSSVQAYIHGGMSSASIRRGVGGRHAHGRVGRDRPGAQPGRRSSARNDTREGCRRTAENPPIGRIGGVSRLRMTPPSSTKSLPALAASAAI
jgi:hypothetical protein